jgi:hypothetical protein
MNVVKRKLLILFSLAAVFSMCSCKEHKRKSEIEKIVAEWIGKEILFPENISCYVSGRETFPEICDEWFQKDFKILMYVDSAGCSDCRLKLSEWKQLMEEADSLFQGKIGFLLFFQPKSTREMTLLFARDRFDYPVFMDINATINRLNSFPEEIEFQCFLLTKDNKVVMIGNPVLNMNIWKLYKSQIVGEMITKPKVLTTAIADKTIHDYGTVRMGDTNAANFTIMNTGNSPLIIFRVSASCGCTNVEWEKQPIAPGKTTTIRVDITPEKTGYFSKTINVYCNIQDTPVKLVVNGNAYE